MTSFHYTAAEDFEDITQVAYPEAKSNHLFSRQLALLVKELAIPAPFFKGKLLPSNVPGVERWEIQSIIPGDPTIPEAEGQVRTGLYTSWEKGIDIAMHGVLSRMCYLYHDKLAENSNFRYFGMRNEEGQPMVTGGDRTRMDWAERHIEDLEIHAVQMEELVNMKAEEANYAQAVIQMQEQEITALHTLVEKTREVVTASELAIAARDQAITAKDQLIEAREQQIFEKDAIIAALQAQLNSPPLESDVDYDEEEEGEDDDNAEASEEEDPEERLFYLSSDDDSEEECPPMTRSPRGRMRKCARTANYMERFKK